MLAIQTLHSLLGVDFHKIQAMTDEGSNMCIIQYTQRQGISLLWSRSFSLLVALLYLDLIVSRCQKLPVPTPTSYSRCPSVHQYHFLSCSLIIVDALPSFIKFSLELSKSRSRLNVYRYILNERKLVLRILKTPSFLVMSVEFSCL